MKNLRRTCVTTIGAVLAAAIGIAACTNSAPAPNPSVVQSPQGASSPSDKPPGVLSLDVDDVGDQLVDSNLPTELAYPPQAPTTPLLDDLPGNAVAQTVMWSGTGQDGWWGHVTYFAGADGRWRQMDMADLGLPDTRAVSQDDTGWEGSLSPDGRYWQFPTVAPNSHGSSPTRVLVPSG